MTKRKIISIDENKCNGCALCIPNCLEGAIQIIDHKARLVSDSFCDGLGACLGHCPQGAISMEEREAKEYSESRLRQWPVQLMLVPAHAPYLQDAELLIAADCVPFAYADFHEGLLKGKALLIGCPKLDDTGIYEEKLGQILKSNDIKSLTYAHMEVPCCFGLVGIIQSVIQKSGKKIPFKEIIISISGEKIK
ncbi:MAG: 4Fe-4S dicluster domain-containing protein [Candidatus Omnitrophota bacterium]